MKANLYHMHHILFKDDIPFWQGLISQTRGDLCLELGCGTGRVMKLLLDSKTIDPTQKMIGLDCDPEMLSIAENILKNNPQFSFVEDDMLTMNLKQKFSLIYLPCNTFSIFSRDEQIQLLQSIKSHLLPNGVFAFSQPNPSVFKKIPNSTEPEMEVMLQSSTSDNPILVSSEWKCLKNSFDMQWHYDELFPDGNVKRTSLNTSHYLTSIKEIKKNLQSNSFNIKNVYGDFDKSSYSIESDNLIIESTIQI